MATALSSPINFNTTREDNMNDLFHQLDSNNNNNNNLLLESNELNNGLNSNIGVGDYNFDPEMLAYLAGQSLTTGNNNQSLGLQQQKFQDNLNNSTSSFGSQSNQINYDSYQTSLSGNLGNSGTGGNASSSSGLSNASSPYSYTGNGSFGASPPFTIVNDTSNGLVGGVPVFTATAYSQYTDSPYAYNQGSKLPPSQTAPTYSNFVAQPSSTYSPPSSTSPNNQYNSNLNGVGGINSNGHNVALARMIAEAQSRQIGNNSTLPIPHSQSQINQTNFTPSLNPSALNNNSYPTSFYPPSLSYSSSDSNGLSSINGSPDENEMAKKRKLGSVDSTNSRKSATGGAGGSQRSHGANSPRSSLSPPLQMRRQNQLQQDPSTQFTFKTISPSVTGTATDITMNSINLIANAGIPSGQDAKKIYQEVPQAKATKNGASAKPPTATSIKLTAAANAKATKAAEKKAAILKKGGDKKKKGDKGHNAVERRYRNNINNAIATLRDIVPALRHLKPLPSMPASRRRASQFTLSTAAQAPTPAGLIDGIPAAKTLSKGTILGKSIEYIQYLQGAREDAAEDIEIFKAVVNEMVSGGSTLVDMYEQRRATREAERERNRDVQRQEQAILDDEDSDGEEEEDDKSTEVKNEYVSDQDQEMEDQLSEQYQQQQQQQYQQQQASTRQSSGSNVNGLAQLRRHLDLSSAGATLPYSNQFDSFIPNGHVFPPSPVSSSEDTSISPRMMMAQQQYRSQQQLQHQGPPRILLASFMGLSFAGGIGYDWTYGMAEEVSDSLGSKAWGGRAAIPAPSSLISKSIVHPGLYTGLLFLAISAVIASAIFLLYPLMERSSSTNSNYKIISESDKNRNAFRSKRRADALASLADLTIGNSSGQTFKSECKSALAARKELLSLVGAPKFFLPALAKEALATALRNIAHIRVGSFSTWSEEARIEAAVAWVRIAEIEATVGLEEVNYLARCYTFLRLFNLSRSSHWPSSTSSTSRASVNAVLALHLHGLGQTSSAHALWNRAATADRKKLDAPLDSWVEIAISTDFERVRTILSTPKELEEPASPSDTVPLMRISESRCEAALRETWAHIFTAVVQTTCPPHSPRSTSNNFATLVDLPLLQETIEHVLASTAEGTSVHSLAKVTRALCCFYTGEVELSKKMAKELAHEARAGGPVARLGCASAFFTLLLVNSDFIESSEPGTETDILATITLGWLTVRRQSSEALQNGEARKADPVLHATTLSIRRLFGAKVFYDESLELEESVDLIGEALTEVTRRAAGLSRDE